MNYECNYLLASGYIGNCTITLASLDKLSIRSALASIGIVNPVGVKVYDSKLIRVY